MQSPWTLEVLLIGRNSDFPDPIYILQISAEGKHDLIAVAPHMQRYFAYAMQPFTNHFYPKDGVYVVAVTLHRIRGFDFLGNVRIAEAELADVRIVRYTHSLEARWNASSSYQIPTSPTTTPAPGN